MSEIPQPPTVGKKLLEESEPLKQYHALVGPYLEQLRDVLLTLRMRDNHGGALTDPATVTAGVDGALSGVFVAADFQPLLVFFSAEELGAAQRRTGLFISGMAQWSSTGKAEAAGFQVTKAPGLTNGTTYSVTFLAIPG